MSHAKSAKEAKQRGHQFYYTGKVCKRGHIDWRRASCGMCIQCEYEKNAEYRRNNAENVRQYAREWARKDYQENPERNRESSRRAYHKNRDHYLQRNKEWCANNRERRNEWKRFRLQNIPGEAQKNRERANRWAQENHDQVIQRNRNRRARVREAEGTHTVADVRRLLAYQKNKCAACYKKLDEYHVDHVIPLAEGGSNYPDNLQILCPMCNASKGAKDPIEWARQSGRLL